MHNKIILLFTTLLIFGACKTNQDTLAPTIAPVLAEQRSISKAPKNIILMIGDGMGLSQITAGMYANNNSLYLEEFPVIGLQKTYAYDDLVTDSAASATAIACGVKTYNTAIGVNPDTVRVTSILEQAEANGIKTGMVATSSITHATPACFIAHQPFRTMYDEIAEDFLKTDIDFFIGGGKKYFDGQRADETSLIPALKEKGYTVADMIGGDLEDIDVMTADKFVYFTANDAPIPVEAGRTYLTEASKKATAFLKSKSTDGFFLMIEGSQIDWGGHANQTNYIVTEMIDFNQTIGAVLEFAKADQETLVIVTADHETGGFAINKPSRMDSIAGAFTTIHHTAAMVPVFAYGPGSEAFSGIYENTAIYDKMQAAFKFEKIKE